MKMTERKHRQYYPIYRNVNKGKQREKGKIF